MNKNLTFQELFPEKRSARGAKLTPSEVLDANRRGAGCAMCLLLFKLTFRTTKRIATFPRKFSGYL